MNVESEIFQVLLTKEQFRDSDYLEIAFGQAVDRLTVEAIRKLGRSPMGHRCQIVANPKDGDSVGIKQLEVIPDDGPSPVDTLLNLEADNHLHQLVHKACDAVDDRRHLKAQFSITGMECRSHRHDGSKKFTARVPKTSEADQVLDRHSSGTNARRTRS